MEWRRPAKFGELKSVQQLEAVPDTKLRIADGNFHWTAAAT
jgi:hypothetical protein